LVFIEKYKFGIVSVELIQTILDNLRKRFSEEAVTDQQLRTQRRFGFKPHPLDDWTPRHRYMQVA
jgi:hypothetical protein